MSAETIKFSLYIKKSIVFTLNVNLYVDKSMKLDTLTSKVLHVSQIVPKPLNIKMKQESVRIL